MTGRKWGDWDPTQVSHPGAPILFSVCHSRPSEMMELPKVGVKGLVGELHI